MKNNLSVVRKPNKGYLVLMVPIFLLFCISYAFLVARENKIVFELGETSIGKLNISNQSFGLI